LPTHPATHRRCHEEWVLESADQRECGAGRGGFLADHILGLVHDGPGGISGADRGAVARVAAVGWVGSCGHLDEGGA